MTTADEIRAWTNANARAKHAYYGNHPQPKTCARCGQPHDQHATTCADCSLKNAERQRAYRARMKKETP